MAKKDKRNRDFDSASSLDDALNGLDELVSSINGMNSELDGSALQEDGKTDRREAPDMPLVDDDTDDDDDEVGGASLLGLPGTILRGGVRIGAASLKLLGRGLLLPLRLTGSLLRRDADEDEDEDDVFEAETETGPTKVDAAEMLVDEEEGADYSPLSKWVLRGGVVAAVLVLAASGYFGYKTVSARSKAIGATVAQDETVQHETEASGTANVEDADGKGADGKSVSTVPQKTEAENAPKVAKNELRPADAAPNKPEPKKPVVVAPPPPVVAEKKPEIKLPTPVAAKIDPKVDPKTEVKAAPETPDKTVAAVPGPPKPTVKAGAKALPSADKDPKDAKTDAVDGAAKKAAVGVAAAATVAAAVSKVGVKTPDLAPNLPVKPDAKTPEKVDAAAKTAAKAPIVSPTPPNTKPVEKAPEKAIAKTATVGEITPAAATVPIKDDPKTTVSSPPNPVAKTPEAAPAKPAEKMASQAPAKSTSSDPWAIDAPAAPAASADPWAVAAPAALPAVEPDKKPAATSNDPWAIASPASPATKTPALAAAAAAPTSTEPAPGKSAPVKTSEPEAPALPALASAPTPAAPASKPKDTSAPPAAAPSKALPSLANTASNATPNSTSNVTPPPVASPPPVAPLVAASDELKNGSTLKPLARRKDVPESNVNEQAPAIPPNQGQTSAAATSAPKGSNTLFGQVPTAPALETAAPEAVPMMQPLRKTPRVETTPTIAHSGNVAAVANPNLTPPKKPELAEAVPVIPVAPAMSSAAAFTTPTTTPQTPVSTLPAMEEQPKIGSATPMFNTLATPLKPATNTAVNEGPGPNIPENARIEQGSAGAFAPLAAATPPVIREASPTIPADPVAHSASTGTPVTPVTKMLPQHTELAKTELPLGSQLQNGVQEIREQAADTPRIRFASSQDVIVSSANPPTSGGAVRFTPRAASDAPAVQPMPMPTHSNERTDLSILLPSGAGSETPENAAVLPPLEAAPTSVLAPVNPGYGRSMRNRNPATASIDVESRAANRERRAMSFQQRISAEIKRSPTETEQYVVQEGDTYMTICDRAYGSSRPFRALAEHNRQKLGVDYRPQPGTVVEIPPANFLETNYSESFRPGRRRSAVRSTGTTGGGFDSSSYRQDRQGVPYVVQQGDTVFNIATDKLKDTSLWREIYAMNTDRISDPRDQLPVGTEIMLPTYHNAQSGVVRR